MIRRRVISSCFSSEEYCVQSFDTRMCKCDMKEVLNVLEYFDMINHNSGGIVRILFQIHNSALIGVILYSWQACKTYLVL